MLRDAISLFPHLAVLYRQRSFARFWFLRCTQIKDSLSTATQIYHKLYLVKKSILHSKRFLCFRLLRSRSFNLKKGFNKYLALYNSFHFCRIRQCLSDELHGWDFFRFHGLGLVQIDHTVAAYSPVRIVRGNEFQSFLHQEQYVSRWDALREKERAKVQWIIPRPAGTSGSSWPMQPSKSYKPMKRNQRCSIAQFQEASSRKRWTEKQEDWRRRQGPKRNCSQVTLRQRLCVQVATRADSPCRRHPPPNAVPIVCKMQ